jgi:NAD(P)-dependent dehydrogenase (short-subunit alcohol dehydrogenase family)
MCIVKYLNCITFPFPVEPQRFTKDGYEEHMQVNHLAPALLAMLLLPSLIRGSPSRIINVNSVVSFLLLPVSSTSMCSLRNQL